MKKLIVLLAMLVLILNIATAQDATKGKTREQTEVKSEKIGEAKKTKREEKTIRKEDPNNSSNFIELSIPDSEVNGLKNNAACPVKKD